MKISELIDIRINYEKSVKTKLIEMVSFFMEYMWNGWEDDPKFITEKDYEAIEALSDKMEHMILNIGCPGSVEDIRKLEYWQAGDNIESEDRFRYEYNKETKSTTKTIVSKGFRKGKQLKNNNDLRRVYSALDYYRK